ncbi:EsaB/YukD family protein [Paenibacillus sp. KQZ6P-2]|uniref:EsaB/YukD family protein n=1 Tax=Paenibacillus mangrovi TaxID=2931978 RepID=A0A9X2B4N2_9BACL|nr:EsaB/YukD family protein [Paenibacillus mangrovi]MCJ8011822.1 EsaB/YukD family protein [Paenibacillus mangrovi]
MEEIMVTLQVDNGFSVDLKIPVFVTAGELLAMLAEGLQLPCGPGSRIQAEPLGRILDHERTLEEEGVAHGALLTLL